MADQGNDTTAVPHSRVASKNYHHVEVSILGEGEEPIVKRILANEDSTFADIKNDLIDAGVPEVTVLRSHYGPKPFWTESNLESKIGSSCQTLYAIRGDGIRYILALVRSSEADYPVAIFDFNQDPLKVALPSTEADSDLEKEKASITRYSNEDPVYNYDSYESLKSQEAGTFPTCFIIILGQMQTRFQSDMPAQDIPPFLLFPFCGSKELLKRAYGVKWFPRQMIRTTGALLHAIIALARVSNVSESFSETQTEPNDKTMLSCDLLLADNLQRIIKDLDDILQIIETGAFDTSHNISKRIDDCFMELCGEFPGAVTIRNSYTILEKLKALDHQALLLDLGIGAINVLRDVSQITGLALGHSNSVGQVLERIKAVLSTLKQMMENRSSWETLLITLDKHQLVLNQQLALLKKDHLDADPTSPFLNPIKKYSTTLEEILAGIIKESGLADKNAPRGGAWETVKDFSLKFVDSSSEKDRIQVYDHKISVAMEQLNLALVLYVSEKLQEMHDKWVEENMLAKLKITDLECGSLLRGCMKGTRQDILEKIKEWTTDFDAPNILWLKGHPGAGKSAIATDVVEQLRTSGRLGSTFFFHRQTATIMTTSLLWCAVAYDLARKYPTIRKRIIAALHKHKLGPTTFNVDKLFLHLIHEPMVESEAIPEDSLPVVVIDALDECGGFDRRGHEYRRSLMQTLKSWSRLPIKFKLIVTSRGESDIERVFSATNHRLVEILAGRTVEPQSSKDIQVFLKYQIQVKVMNEYEESLPPNYGAQVAEDLAERAAGLFIWAETVINFISLGDFQRRLEQVLKGSGPGDMNALYSQILRSSFGQATKEEINNFCAVVGTIILAKVPLSVLSLQELLSLDELAVRVVCNGLQSVLDSRNTLKFHHRSFVDFLMDPERSPHHFRVERNRESRNLTLACLRVMKNKLKFNICDMTSSYLRNSDVPDLEAQIEECIPPYVSYSCLFWANHLADTAFDVEVFECLQHFMQNQFLFWLEILSLIKRVNIASSMLLLLVDWIKAGQRDDVLARDMWKFVAGFGSVISQSVPHIYLSALPFSPRNSAVSMQYRQRFPRTILMKTGGLINWPVVQNVLSGHSDRVTSIAFSPDGGRIISGSHDKPIRVWNAETGEMVAGPLSHSEGVTSIAISPDGTHIVSSSASEDKAIRVWDVETGEVVTGPLEGHMASVTSVAFSGDGTRIISGSNDRTIRVWDAETGEAVAGPFSHDELVTSIAISPAGTHVVSGSADHRIRVWDVETGEVVTGPLEGHIASVTSVAFSPDGTHIVSGSNDKTIRVWDAETGEEVTGPFNERSDHVISVGFSPNGRHIISGQGKEVHVWDAGTGEVVAGPFSHSEYVNLVAISPDGTRIVSGEDKAIWVWSVEADVGAGHVNGHTKAITSVAFSRDGKRITSSSEDKTIRVWDAETGEEVAGPFNGHSDYIISVAFSPDGRRIISGSYDSTIRVWDAETGEMVAGPLNHSDSVDSVAISPDGTRIVSGEGKVIRVWNAETGAVVVGPFEGHIASVTSVAFSPNGMRIASAGDEKIRVWDAETGAAVIEPFEGHRASVTSVAFSEDGTRLVSGSWDKTIRVWDIETGAVVAGPFEGHGDWITSVAFSPDGTHVVSGSWDKTIRVWEAETGEVVVGPWRAHNNRVLSVKFSPDGKRLLSASGTTIWVWDFLIDESTYLDYNLPPFSLSGMHNGWILGANSECLLWVPPALRDGLCWPRKRLAIGDFIKTTLDLDHFVHGKSWSQCKS